MEACLSKHKQCERHDWTGLILEETMMRIAVISDMHGNDLAFEAVEADIKKQGVDQMVCLGDAVQGGSQPAEIVQRLRRLNCPVVMGNADAWLITGKETAD